MQNSTDVKKAPTRAGTLLWLAVLTMLLHVSWFVLLFALPMQKKRFDERGAQLPQLTKEIINLAIPIWEYCDILVPLSVTILWGGLIMGRHVTPNPRIGNVFAIFALLILLSSTAILLLCWSMTILTLLKYGEPMWR